MAYEATRDAISAAEPNTLDWALVVARAAVVESEGKEPCHHDCDEHSAGLAAT